MKKIFKSLKNNLKGFQQIEPHLRKCQLIPSNHQHNLMQAKSTVIPIAISKDFCKTCDEHMCTACADDHIQNHCSMKLNTNKNMGNGILKDFNYGVLIKADLRDLKCICGNKLQDHMSTSGICAACGLASCSHQCHKHWEKEGNCTFYQNFQYNYDYFNSKIISIPQLKSSLRSILLQNIENIRKANIKRWSPAQRTRLNLIACYASKQKNFVYFQRGYRNYGNPNEQFLERFQYAIPKSLQYYYQNREKLQQNNNKVEKSTNIFSIPKYLRGLDFQTHIERLCPCQCQVCYQRQYHSVGNCQQSCIYGHSFSQQINQMNAKNQMQCHCQCQFCRSGIIMDTHRVIDCSLHCALSKISKFKI